MGSDGHRHRDDFSSSSSSTSSHHSHSWQEKAARAKRKHRPTLKNWEVDGLAESFPNYVHAILESKYPYRSFRLVENVIDDDGDIRMGENTECPRSGNTKKILVEERRQSLECARLRHRQHRHCHSNYTSHNHDSIIDVQAEEALNNNNNKIDEAAEQQVKYPLVLHASDTPPAIFHEFYEAHCTPVIIRDIPMGYHRHHHQQPGDCERRGGEDTDFNSDRHENTNNTNNYKHGNQYLPIPNISSITVATTTIATTLTEAQNECCWPAIHRWTLPSLSHDTTLLDRPFKAGEDDDGHAVHMKLRHFLQYMQCNHDDSPLYIFDATFDEDKRGAARLLVDYTVPQYFNEDLLSLVGERRRPPYRWFLVGPTRSGTTVHVDPLGTSAWNTLIVGVKRWVLFPPHVPKSVVKGSKLVLPGEDDEAIHYFTTILPRMKRRAAAVAAMANNHCGGSSGGSKGSGKDQLGGYANFECYEFTQYPGETVYIPHGWWHAVLNLTDTVGITQNYCSRRNFDAVWTQARSGRKKMSCSWLRKLDVVHPDLACRARELNARDGYVMLEEDSPEERAKRRERKREERREKEERRKKKHEESGDRSQQRHDKNETQNQKQSKEGKWGDHRIAERRRRSGNDEEDEVGEGDAIAREVSPD